MMPGQSLRKQLRPLKFTRPTIHWLRHLVPLIFIGLGVQILLPQLSNLKLAWRTVEKMPRWALFLAPALQIATFGGYGFLMSSLATMLNERLALVRGTLMALAGNSLVLVAGMVGYSASVYRWAVGSGVGSQVAGLCGTLPIILSDLLLAVLAVLGLIHLFLIHELTRLQALSFGFVLAVLGLLLLVSIWGVTHPEWLLRLLDGLGRRWAKLRKRPYAPESTENFVNELVDTWLVLRSGGWRGPVLGASMAIFFDMLTLYVLFAAAGNPISLGALLTGYGLPLLIGRVSFFPGGVGIVEATMTAIYASLGVPGNVIVVVILGYRLFAFWIPTLVGFPTAVYLQQMVNGKGMTTSTG